MATFRQELAAKSPRVATSAQSGRSRAAALKLMCLECVGGTRAHISDCTDKGCPLWLYRPYQRDDEPDDAVEGGVEP